MLLQVVPFSWPICCWQIHKFYDGGNFWLNNTFAEQRWKKDA
jgi:hypothetical protein